jgi:hypothetical protein
MVIQSAERPLYNSLEDGFRHHPLSPKEMLDRYAETCYDIKTDLLWLYEELNSAEIQTEGTAG